MEVKIVAIEESTAKSGGLGVPKATGMQGSNGKVDLTVGPR